MNDSQKQTILITGTAGYVGAMLADQFSSRDDVEKIICVDKDNKPGLLEGNDKVEWVTSNTADQEWKEVAEKERPSTLIHCAWQIREMYGKKKEQWRWNVTGSDEIFNFAFEHDFVKKLIYFSTVSSYGAEATNTLSQRFVETDPFREEEYSYGVEKKAAEAHLKERFERAKEHGENIPQVFIVRPVAITGPRGRNLSNRFGLQAALSGKLSKSLLHRFVSLLLSFMPTTPGWSRQFIHEDDVTDIVALFAFDDCKGEYEAFNICPPGSPVLAQDMADAVGKKTVRVPERMIQFVFFVFWHLTRGRIPTPKGVWRFYSYPVLVDGSKLTDMHGFKYRMGSHEAFKNNSGRYAQ